MARPAVRNVLLILLAILAGSCKEDGTTGTPLPPVLSLTTPTLAVSLRGANDSLSQNVTLLSGSEPISWTASSTAPWVHVNLLSGTTPSTISVTARSAGLAPGTHTGVVTFTAPGATNSPVQLVINATIEAQPILVVPTDTLTFAGTAGQAEAGQRTLAIANSGTGTLNWTASSTSPWIRITPSSGTGAATLTIAAGATDLSAGTWHGSVSVTSAGAMSSPRVVPVKLVLAPRMFAVTAVANPGPGGTVTGAGSYPQGANAQLNAVPANGFDFTNWTENGVVLSNSPTYSFAVTADRSLTANFAPRVVTVSITTSAQPAAGGTTTGAGTYPAGTMVSLQATANPGNTFVNWTEAGAVVSTSANYSFVATVSRSLVANFTNTPTQTLYNVFASANPAEGGTVTGSGAYAAGTSATLTATPTAPYTFDNWTENGVVVSTEPSYTHVVTRDRTLVANFVNSPPQTIYSVGATAMPAQGGTISGAGTYFSGTSATLTATPNPTYTFLNWTENGAVVAATPTYTHIVTRDRSLVANFAESSQTIYTVSVSASPTEGGTVSGAGKYVHGTPATLTATPNPTYSFVNWTENGVGVSTSPTYTHLVTGDRNLVANFVVGPPPPIYTIFASGKPTEGGTVSGAGTYVSGTEATLTATPTAPYTFVNWTENGVEVATTPTYTHVVTRERTLVANFSARYTVTATASPPEGGTVTGGGTYEVGTAVAVGATPNTGWTFKEWRDGSGRVVSNQRTYIFQVRADTTLTAYFLPPGYIEISFIEPRENSLHGDSLFINVAVTSSHTINSVTATVEGRTVSLSPFPQRWMGTLNLAGLTSGQKTVVITATNSFGNTVTASTTFWLDRLPVITVSAPVPGTVARPTFNYSATCTDDDPAGCVSLTLYAYLVNQPPAVVLASGTNSLNGVADLSAYRGQRVLIWFAGVDSRGQVSRWQTEILVE